MKSYRSLERRREILKDSHVGSFAVIGIVLLILAQFAAFASVPDGCDLRVLSFVPAVSRCCSALAVTALPSMSTSQYADRQKPKSHLLVLAVMLGVFLFMGFLFCGRDGLALIGTLIGYAFALRKGYQSLEVYIINCSWIILTDELSTESNLNKLIRNNFLVICIMERYSEM